MLGIKAFNTGFDFKQRLITQLRFTLSKRELISKIVLKNEAVKSDPRTTTVKKRYTASKRPATCG